MKNTVNKIKSLLEYNSEIAAEWNYEKNDELLPQNVRPMSNKKVWWKCKVCGYEWEAVIASRIGLGTGCPKCGKVKNAKNRSLPKVGESLQDKLPEIAKEWNYDKNGDLKPTDVKTGSNKKVWWKCQTCGHEWETSINNRTFLGRGCPKCGKIKALKNRSLPKLGESLQDKLPEVAKEWNYEKNGKLKPDMVTCGSNKRVWWKCNRCGYEWESVIYRRSNGSYCPKCSMEDLSRKLSMPKLGESLQERLPEVAKEWNYEKNGDLKPTDLKIGSKKKVWWKCSKCGHEWKTAVNNRSRGSGCPICGRLKSDKNRSLPKIGKSLQDKYPELAKEWNYEKNGNLLPNMVNPVTGRKVWWKCAKGHEWQAKISNRRNGKGCPICSNQVVLVGYNDLASVKPELAKEWNYEKNGDLKPTDVAFGSNRKVWWKCQTCGHEWQTVIVDRSNGTGCPVCAGREVLEGYNDLATVKPELIQEWNYEKNGGLKPTDVTIGSNRKVWWRCKTCGHEWKAKITNRSFLDRGCPKCSSIYGTSFSEQAVYYFLKMYFSNTALNRFLLTDEDGIFEVDIFLPTINCAIEYDGIYWHRNRRKKDEQKDIRLKKLNISLFRVIESTENKMEDNCIYYNFNKCPNKNLSWAIEILLEKLGLVNIIVDVEQHNHVIRELFYTSQLKNSLAAVNPQLAKEWHPEKNGKLKPTNITPGSNQKVWWKCSKGHEWQATISSRNSGVGCPICSNRKVLIGFNDLTTCCPELAKEWNYEKNGEVKPTMVTPGSDKKVWWKCSKGHEWQAMISSRNKGGGCPICSNQVVLVGYNDLASVKPELAKEWNYEKNGDLKPTDVAFGSNRKVWWKCQTCGHEWQTVIVDRSNGTGCPVCAGREVLEGYNDLATVKPELIQEWNFEKNGDLKPSDVTSGSNKKVWWKCQTCGYEWQTVISSRSKGSGCPICGKLKNAKNRSLPKPGESLQDNFPGLVKEWNFEKNGDLKPDMVRCGSDKKVWWKCSKGHEWEAVIGLRTKGANCPICFGRQVLVGFNDLTTINPELAKEWNYDRNGSLQPSGFTLGSNQKVWWKCQTCGHEWQAKINSRSSGNGCPKCNRIKVAKARSLPKPGESLQDKHPELIKEWDYDKNIDLKPDEVSSGSGKRAWWKCSKCGHEWQSIISNRTKGRNCPKCSRLEAAKARSLPKPGESLQDKHPELIKEWDYDKNIDLKPDEVSCGSSKKVWWKCSKCGHEWEAMIGDRTKGRNCPKCSRLEAAKAHSLPKPGESLQDKLPELAKEWDLVKNGDLKPTMVTPGSNKKAWWKCSKGHEWEAVISSRSSGVSCPVCANKMILIGYNDLATNRPELAKEWNFEKNGDLKPTMVTPGSNKKVWWKCSKGHEWKAFIANRSKGIGCPYCSNKLVLMGYNDLATVKPELAAEWNYEKNGDLKPTMVTPGSNKKVWWKCQTCGYEWQTVISSRSNGNGCPKCGVLKRANFFSTPKPGESLQDKLPELAKEWNYEKNDDLRPDMVRYGSNQKVWWKCTKGHVWEAIIGSRSKGAGCPVCAGQKSLEGVNDLATVNPVLAEEWNYAKNGGLCPSQFKPNSSKKVWWKCKKCGYEWQDVIGKRNRGNGCPKCKNDNKPYKST